MAAGTNILIKRKAGAFVDGNLAAGELGVNTTNGDVYVSRNGSTVTLINNATHTGDVTGSSALTLATVNSNVGSFGSATTASIFTVNAKGLITAASSATIAPAVGNVTGLGTGVASALSFDAGSSGGLVVFNSALGTPSSGTLTNCTGLPTAGLLNNAVTYAKFQATTGSQVLIGNPTGSAGNVQEIGLNSTLSIVGTSLQRSALTGDVTASAGSNTTTIANNAVTSIKILNSNVTYAKIQNVSANRLLGNYTGSAAAPMEIAINETLEFNSNVLRRAALTGDVTAAAGSNTTTIANGVIAPTNLTSNALEWSTTGLSVSGANGNYSLSIVNTSSTASRYPNFNITDYGNFSGYPLLQLGTARGNSGTPTGTASGDILGEIRWRGYGASAFRITGGIRCIATQNFTDTAAGTALVFLTARTGAGSFSESMRIAEDGSLLLGTTSRTPNIILDINSTGQAIRIPRMTTTQRNNMTPQFGMLIYNTTTNKLNVRVAGAWEQVTSA